MSFLHTFILDPVYLSLLFLNTLSSLRAIFCISPKCPRLLGSLLVILSSVCIIFFLSTTWFNFYIYFELRLIPIMLIVIGWGYQIERLRAAKAIILYTIGGSAPLLICVAWSRSTGVIFLAQANASFRRGPFFWVSTGLLLAFLVKLPILFLHIWLPKAHVEAPVLGSIFLAAVLLKLGGFGILKGLRVLTTRKILAGILAAISLWRIAFVSVACTQAVDVKVLIALSSVAHIGAGLLALISNFELREVIFLLVLVRHGFSSSIIFFQRFIFYKNSSTRRLLLNKRVISIRGRFILIWILSCLAILGAPPTFNLWVEIIVFSLRIVIIPRTIKILFWGALITGAYAFMCIRVLNSGNQYFLIFSLKTYSLLDIRHLLFSSALVIRISVCLPISLS